MSSQKDFPDSHDRSVSTENHNLKSTSEGDPADEHPSKQELDELGLQIQLSATAVATSIVLIFIPNIETLSFMAFFVGFLFTPRFALKTIITMSLTWEIFATLVFSFSGITFPFKIISWLIIGFLGHFARRVHVKYYFEFMIFGIISALAYDLIVTLPLALFFVSNQGPFLSVLLSNIVLGLYFTISHIIGNGLLFSFIPLVIHNVYKLLTRRYRHLVTLPPEYFSYMDDYSVSEKMGWKLPAISIRRKSIYAVILIVIISLTTVSFIYQSSNPPDDETVEIQVQFLINYHNVKANDSYAITVLSNNSVLDILENLTTVQYTSRFGDPYITGINGVIENVNITGYSWNYYINRQYASRGASNQYLQNADFVEWRYE